MRISVLLVVPIGNQSASARGERGVSESRDQASPRTHILPIRCGATQLPSTGLNSTRLAATRRPVRAARPPRH